MKAMLCLLRPLCDDGLVAGQVELIFHEEPASVLTCNCLWIKCKQVHCLKMPRMCAESNHNSDLNGTIIKTYKDFNYYLERIFLSLVIALSHSRRIFCFGCIMI